MSFSLSQTCGDVVRNSARWAVSRYYRRIDVEGAERIPAEGPLLLCGNHPNSLLDPVVIGIAAGRRIRFLAKAPLFDIPLLGSLMRSLGMIPAFRGRDDRRQVGRNVESLDVAARLLAEGEAVGIFPEGKSHDLVHLEQVRGGPSRIALAALGLGAEALQVVPLGLDYEQKERFRSRIEIRVAEPIRLADWLEGRDGDEKRRQRMLTDELALRMRRVVLSLDEPEWAAALDDLAALTSRGDTDPIVRRRQIASAMNHYLEHDRPQAEVAQRELTAYGDALARQGLGRRAAVLRWKRGELLAAVLQLGGALLLLLPAAIVGLLFHLLPFGLQRLVAGRLQSNTRTDVAFYRLLVGLPVFVLWYALAGWWLWNAEFTPLQTVGLLTMLLACGLAALAFLPRAREALRDLLGGLRLLFNRRELHKLRAQRAQLVTRLDRLADDYLHAAGDGKP